MRLLDCLNLYIVCVISRSISDVNFLYRPWRSAKSSPYAVRRRHAVFISFNALLYICIVCGTNGCVLDKRSKADIVSIIFLNVLAITGHSARWKVIICCSVYCLIC